MKSGNGYHPDAPEAAPAPPVTEAALEGGRQIARALDRFGAAKEGARKFQKEEVGDVDPGYCFSDFLASIRDRDRARLEKVYRAPYIRTAMAASTGGATGGYLVPVGFREELMKDVSEEAFVRPEALVIPMERQTVNLPLPDAETVTGTAGVPPFWGGVQMTFGLEAGALGETAEAKFRQVVLRANELTGYALVSNELMADSPALDAWMRRMFGRAIGWYEDYFFLRGTGVGQPLGMLNSSGVQNVTRSTTQPSGITGIHIQYLDLATMLSKLLPYSYLHASWYITVSAMLQVIQLFDQGGKTAWVPNYPVQTLEERKEASRSIGALFGRPCYVTEKLPVFNTVGDVLLADPSLYVIGDRQEITIDVSQESSLTNWQANRAAWRVIERVDGRPFFDKSITLGDQATVVAPIVILN